jgi:hypothetical protein
MIDDFSFGRSNCIIDTDLKAPPIPHKAGLAKLFTIRLVFIISKRTFEL